MEHKRRRHPAKRFTKAAANSTEELHSTTKPRAHRARWSTVSSLHRVGPH
ncbi:MAG TPA: hypothetical protein VMV04_18085 [Thermodesulfobacteriota bacterium]|nr:hypothetical protein [Thermodesulfobacteriota bacterium]